MKFGQLVEYNKRNTKIIKKIKEADYFQTSFFIKRALYEVESSCLQISFDIFW